MNISKNTSNNYLIIIGTHEFPSMGASYPPLSKVEYEIEEIKKIFVNKEQGYKLELELIDKSNDEIKNELNRFFSKSNDKLKESDNIVVYITGHGNFDGNSNQHYLYTHNSDIENPGGTAIRTSLLASWFFENYTSEYPPPNVLLLLDVCFSGEGAAEAIKLNSPPNSKDKFLVIASSGSLDTASEGAFVKIFKEIVQDNGWMTKQRGEFLSISDLVSEINKRFSYNKIPQQAEINNTAYKSEKSFIRVKRYINMMPSNHQPTAFVGRNALIDEIKEGLKQRQDVALYGLNGMGKTSVVLELGNDESFIKDVFPDGVLWVSLGENPDFFVMFGQWLDIFNNPSVAALTENEQRRSAIHEALGVRRMLLVIDDVRTTEDLNDFLKINNGELLGGKGCARIITSVDYNVAGYFPSQLMKAVAQLEEEDARDLFDLIDPRIRNYVGDEIQELIESIGIGRCPFVVALIANKLRAEINVLDNLSTAISNSSEKSVHLAELLKSDLKILKNSGDENNRIKELIRSSIDRFPEEDRKTLYTLSVFPASPNSFDIEDACIICIDENEDPNEVEKDKLKLCIHIKSRYKLLQVTKIEGGQQRCAIIPMVRDICYLQVDDVCKKRFAEHYLNMLQKNISNQKIDLERKNILEALNISLDMEMYDDYIKAINRFYHYLEIRGEYKTAKELLSKAENFSKEDSKESNAMIQCRLGAIAYYQHDYDLARKHYDKANSLAYYINDPHNRYELKKGFSELEFKAGAFGEVRKICEEALHTLGKLTRAEKMGFYAVWGQALDIQGQYQDAEKRLNQGYHIGDIYNNKEEQAILEQQCILLGHKGWVSAHQGKFSQAKGFWSKGLKIANNENITSQVIFLNANLGWIYDREGDYKEAERYFNSGLTLASHTGYMYGKSVLLLNKGAALLHRGLYDQAETCLNESRDIEEESVDTERRAVTYENLGILYSKRGLLLSDGEAEDCFKKGLDIAGNGIQERKCAIKTFLADVYRKQGETAQQDNDADLPNDCFEKAKGLLEEAISLAKDLQNPERLATAYKYYGIILDRQDNIKAKDYLLNALEFSGGNRTETIANKNTALPYFPW